MCECVFHLSWFALNLQMVRCLIKQLGVVIAHVSAAQSIDPIQLCLFYNHSYLFSTCPLLCILIFHTTNSYYSIMEMLGTQTCVLVVAVNWSHQGISFSSAFGCRGINLKNVVVFSPLLST
jgi:hypothetical protein